MQKTNDRAVAKELVQTVFVSFFNHKSTAHQISSVKAYLYTILKNRILDHHRRLLSQQKFRDYAAQLQPVPVNDVYAYIETKELEQQLQQEIAKLPPQCKNVFRLRREQELSNKEIALHLNISENTVEQHMRKALRLLKQALHTVQRTFIF